MSGTGTGRARRGGATLVPDAGGAPDDRTPEPAAPATPGLAVGELATFDDDADEKPTVVGLRADLLARSTPAPAPRADPAPAARASRSAVPLPDRAFAGPDADDPGLGLAGGCVALAVAGLGLAALAWLLT